MSERSLREKEKKLQADLVKVQKSRRRVVQNTTPKTGAKPQKALAAGPRELGFLIMSHFKRGGAAKDIPFVLPTSMKRTQVVEIRLVSDFNDISVTTATAYNTVISVIFSLFGNNSNLKNTFDEVRPVRGQCYYIPRLMRYPTTATAASPGGAVLEYATSTVLGSSTALLEHDNHVLFYLFAFTQPGARVSSRNAIANAIWPILPDNMPDQEWQDANAPTNFAYWKPYFRSSDIDVTAVAGWMVFECDFQFRGLK